MEFGGKQEVNSTTAYIANDETSPTVLSEYEYYASRAPMSRQYYSDLCTSVYVPSENVLLKEPGVILLPRVRMCC
jgi:hypothetical protein